MAEALPLEGLVTCAVCQEIYREPLALRCLHTLCKGCVQTMQRRSMISHCIQCPMCRERSDTRCLKHDFRVSNLVEIYMSQQKLKREISVEISDTACCQLCRKKTFTSRCMDCNKLICDSCQATHNSIPMCETHTVVPLPDMLSDCSVQIGRINDALVQDRNSLVAKFHTLVDYLNDLEKVKQEITESLDNSEMSVVRRVNDHYISLREELENSINEHRVKAESAKGKILDVIGKVMGKSQKIVDALSGVDVGSVLLKIEDLKTENEIIDIDKDLQLPKFEARLVEDSQWGSFDLSNVAKFEFQNPDSKFQPPKTNDKFEERSVSEVLQNAAHFLERAEKSTIHYKFQYCDQVCVMLSNLQQTLNKYAEDSKDQCEIGASCLGKSHSMVSPSSLSVNEPRPQINCEELISSSLENPIMAQREVLLSKCDEPQSLRIFGDEIWCIYQDWVNVYDHNLKLKNKHQRRWFGENRSFLNMKTMVRAADGHYFQACETHGLRILQPMRRFLRSFDGTVVDVITHDEYVFALDIRAGDIWIFKYDEPENPQPRESPWKLERTIKSQCALSVDDTLAFVNDVIIVCSYRNDAIYRYGMDGGVLATTPTSPSRKGPGHLWRPRICCKTNSGALIIADHYHNRLQLLSPQGEWRVLKFKQDLNFPWDAVLANDSGLVVLEKCNWKHKLVQFVQAGDLEM